MAEEEKEVKEKKPEAKKVSAKRSTDKWKRKRWFQILAPVEFEGKLLGETPAEKDKQLLGRTIRANLSDLTGQRQRRHITILLKVREVKGQQLSTALIGHEIAGSYIGRMVRRRSSKMEVYQNIVTRDGVKIYLHSVALSVKKLSREQKTAIRNAMRELVEKGCKKNEFKQLFQMIAFGVLASKVFKDVKKIAPLKRLEIVKSKVIEGKEK